MPKEEQDSSLIRSRRIIEVMRRDMRCEEYFSIRYVLYEKNITLHFYLFFFFYYITKKCDKIT